MKLNTQHSLDYDLYNAEKLVDEFLLNVKNRVTRYSFLGFFYQVWFFLRKHATFSYVKRLKQLRTQGTG